MATDLIDDRGSLVGTRVTVYNLLPYFLDPEATEDLICHSYGLAPEQVAAARAFVLRNPDTVLAQHLKIEERIADGNPPSVVEQAKRSRAVLLAFKRWLAERDQKEAQNVIGGSAGAGTKDEGSAFPTFRDWLEQQASRPADGR